MITLKNKTLKIHDTSTGTDVDLNAIKGNDYELTEQDKSEIASQIHYDDTELRAEIESKAEVFVAEYGVTTYAEVKNAYESGKQVYCLRQFSNAPLIYVLARVGTTQIYFGCLYSVDVYVAYVSDNNAWASVSLARATNISETSKVSNGYFPTTKAVADFYLGTNVAPLSEAEKKSARERIGFTQELIAEATFEDTSSGGISILLPNGEKKLRILLYSDLNENLSSNSNSFLTFFDDNNVRLDDYFYVNCANNIVGVDITIDLTTEPFAQYTAIPIPKKGMGYSTSYIRNVYIASNVSNIQRFTFVRNGAVQTLASKIYAKVYRLG